MKKTGLIALLLLGMTSSVQAQSKFEAEIGDYSYNFFDIRNSLEKQLGYVHAKSDLKIGQEKYKLISGTNEYQVKDWFKRDWYKLQSFFELDFDAYLRSQHAQTFNEAKRAQYSNFVFDGKSFVHLKVNTPSMKEWGGLTHPPIKKLNKPLSRYHKSFKDIDYFKIQSPYFDPNFQKELDAVSKSELTFGNRLTPLADKAAFNKKKFLISNARHSIFMSSLVFVCDESTKEITRLLIEKHQSGLEVKVITDGSISYLLGYTACLDMMSKEGIEVIRTADLMKHNRSAIYHTKTLIVDSKEAIAGGQNMIKADNWSLGTNFMNRDVDLHVKGPMVLDIEKQFMENWQYHSRYLPNTTSVSKRLDELRKKLESQRRSGIRGQRVYSEILSLPEFRMKGVCRFIKQAPYEDGNTIGKAYLKLLDKVSNYLFISDPIKSDTFVTGPDDVPYFERKDTFKMLNQLHARVQRLAKSGLSIDYQTTNIAMAGNEFVTMLNEDIRKQLEAGSEFRAGMSLKFLNYLNNYFGLPHYKNLMKDWAVHKNVHVWNHMSFMHSKIFYFDRIVASIGSLNFHHNATDHAYESTSICMDESLNKQLDRIVVQDMANSIPLIYKSVK